jgi:hypothetical protein
MESGDWDLSADEASELVGAMSFLHETKKQPSYFGGVIESYRQVQTDNEHHQRIIFRFRFVPTGKGQLWSGANHARAWTSGVVEE